MEYIMKWTGTFYITRINVLLMVNMSRLLSSLMIKDFLRCCNKISRESKIGIREKGNGL